jgi:protein-tyrosine phosphatase
MSLLHRLTDGPEPIQIRFGTARGMVRLWLAELARLSGRLRRFETVDWPRVSRLVFVCTGNICRSPYGEWKARQLGCETASFGLRTSTGQPADAVAQAAALRRGVDMSNHRSRSVDDFTPQPGDLLIAMELGHLVDLAARFGSADGVQITLAGLWSTPRRTHLHDPHSLLPGYFDRCFEILDGAVGFFQKSMPKACA